MISGKLREWSPTTPRSGERQVGSGPGSAGSAAAAGRCGVRSIKQGPPALGLGSGGAVAWRGDDKTISRAHSWGTAAQRRESIDLKDPPVFGRAQS